MLIAKTGRQQTLACVRQARREIFGSTVEVSALTQISIHQGVECRKRVEWNGTLDTRPRPVRPFVCQTRCRPYLCDDRGPGRRRKSVPIPSDSDTDTKDHVAKRDVLSLRGVRGEAVWGIWLKLDRVCDRDLGIKSRERGSRTFKLLRRRLVASSSTGFRGTSGAPFARHTSDNLGCSPAIGLLRPIRDAKA